MTDKNLINCGTFGYPLTPEERTGLVERDGVMVKPNTQLTKPCDMGAICAGCEPRNRDGSCRDAKPSDENEDIQRLSALIRAQQITIEKLEQALAALVREPTVEDNSQNWAGMDGATAWHLIDRHADGWADVAKMMGEWIAANTTSPAAHPAPAVRVPMTPDQTIPMYRAAWAAFNDPRINNLADQINNVVRVVIYGVETAHGITKGGEA